jgi:hypothetical protein
MPAATTFELRGVVHLVRPWGSPARDVDQLLHGIASAPAEVLFRHAVQHQLRHPGAEELAPDDFTSWIGGVVQDSETAERLSFEVQGGHTTPEALRAALVAVLETLPVGKRIQHDAPEGSAFVFLSATSLSFPAGIEVHDAHELVDALMSADSGVWFFHLIEQPFLSAGRAPLLDWLALAGSERLVSWLDEAAHAGLPIDKARARLLKRWRQSHIGRRLAEAAEAPEDARRELGRQAVARLLRRTRSGGES